MNKISPMRRAIGLVMVMVGVVWFLIGLNLIEGSQFSGKAGTTIIGAIVAVAGVFVLQWKAKAPGIKGPADHVDPPAKESQE